jgi:hypothetical protein
VELVSYSSYTKEHKIKDSRMAKRIINKTDKTTSPVQTLKVESVKKEKIRIPVNIKGNYLPNILIKLQLQNLRTNGEARNHIRNAGVYINGIKTKDIDYPINRKKQIDISIDNETVFEVFIL